MPSTPHNRTVLSTFAMMALQASLCRTSPNCSRSTYLVRSNGSPALTGHYLVDILPQPDILSGQNHFVASGQQVLPLIGVADLESGDLVGVADAPLFAHPAECLATPYPRCGAPPWSDFGQPGLCGRGLDGRGGDSSRRAAALAGGNGTFEPSPTFCISTRLGPTPTAPAGDRVRLTRPWLGPPGH